MNEYLRIKWTVSRARDTYGYRVCTLTDTRGRKTSCNGGGYDMTGTALGDYLNAWHQSSLMAIRSRAMHHYTDGGFTSRNESGNGLYGLTYHQTNDDGSGWVSIDGACGVGSVITIARAAGIELREDVRRGGRNRGDVLGFVVSPVETAGE